MGDINGIKPVKTGWQPEQTKHNFENI